MGARQLIILGVAGLAAICLALVIAITMKHRPAQAAAAAEPPPRVTVQVLVAKHDLAIGSQLAAGDLAWQPWPADAVNPAFITDGHGDQPVPSTTAAVVAAKAGQVANAAATSIAGGGPMEALYGAMVRLPILANEPIQSAKLLRAGEGGYMAVVLKPGMRAVSIPVSVTSAAGGFILPGDRVDVIQARPADPAANGGRPGFTVYTVLRNIRVLAIDQSVAPTKGSESIVGATATLEVADDDAKTLTVAKAAGEMTLALRPFTDTTDPAKAKTVTLNGAVRIFRGGQASDVMVSR